MGVRAALVAITQTAGDLSQAPDDMLGNMKLAELKCQELTQLLTRIQTVMTAAGDSGNAATVGTQITALS